MQIALMGHEYGDTFTTGWQLAQGSGDRYFDKAVPFQTPLPATPFVHVTLSTTDSDKQWNLRDEVTAVNVSSSGFTLRIHTWADTRLYAVKARWFAVIP